MIEKIREMFRGLPLEVKYVLLVPIVLASIYFTLELLAFFTILYYPYFSAGAGIFVFLVAILTLAMLKKR